MQTITILPNDVSVAWMPETNQYQITINRKTMLEKETGNLLMENLFGELDEFDLVQCNEINPLPNDTWITVDGKIYIFNGKNIAELKEKGETIISCIGLVKDKVDLNIESHIDFILWFYNSDTIEEAVENMNRGMENE